MTTRNIIILPTPDVAGQAIVWSRKIASEYKTNFVLDGKQFYPHITVYQAAYPDKNFPQVETQLKKLVKNIKPFTVKTGDFSTLVGFIFLNFDKSEELVSLHKQIVGICNPIREGENIPAEVKNLTDPHVPEFIKHSIRTYGSALAMDAYMPHITLSRLQNPSEADKVLVKLRHTKISFDVQSVRLGNIGLDGTVNEVFKEFPFQMI
jgi:2'-5' RNA ligase